MTRLSWRSRTEQAERAAEILKQSMVDAFAETFPGAPLNGLVEPHIGMSWAEKDATGGGMAKAIPVSVSAEKPAVPRSPVRLPLKPEAPPRV